MNGAERIMAERKRQLDVEGWNAEHDSQHKFGDLAVQAAVCAVDGTDAEVIDPLERGSENDNWELLKKHGYRGEKPDEIKLLSIAGALIAAEIDRIIANHATEADS